MQNSRDIKECLDDLLDRNDKVFIVPHNNPDMDALGAAIGMSLICDKKRKENYIVIDDNIEKIESVTRKVIESVKEKFKIINASEAKKLLDDKSLLLAVDVNKDHMISVSPFVDRFNDIFVLDHHKPDEHTLNTHNLFIDDKLSSTCEEVSRLILLYDIDLSVDEANYLLAGIVLDTNKLTSSSVNTSTLSVVTELTCKGANLYFANNMFIEDFEHDRAIQRLVNNTEFSNDFSISSDSDDSGIIYDIVDIAKASDYSLKYQVTAAFAIAYIDKDTISISARSKGIIDVSQIMKTFGGGGNEHSAAARVKGKTIEEIKRILKELLMQFVSLNQINVDEKQSVLKLSSN